MPGRNDRSAPQFSGHDNRELERYFEDLEDLFGPAQIATEANKKKYAIKYVSVQIADAWRYLPEYVTPATTYMQFKAAVYKLYPSATNQYSLHDLDIIIDRWKRTGIASLHDLSSYHVEFTTVAGYLIAKTSLDEMERDRLYPKALPLALVAQVHERLYLAMPTHVIGKPFRMNDIYTNATRVLAMNLETRGSLFGIGATGSVVGVGAAPLAMATQRSTRAGIVSDVVPKVEETSTAIADLARAIAALLEQRAEQEDSE